MTVSERKGLAHGLLLTLAATTCLGAGELVIKPYQTGAERRLDNPVDAWMNAWAGPAGAEVKAPEKQKGDFRRYEILSDDSKNGDFSITFTVDNPKQQSAFGFSCGKYIDRWEVGPKASLHLWLKLDTLGNPTPARVVLHDQSGKSAGFVPGDRPADKTWQELDLPLAKFTAADGFDFNAVRSVQVECTLPKGAQVWLDDVYFHEGDNHLGVTDKTITQYMAETAATRPKRAARLLGGWTGIRQDNPDKANHDFGAYVTQWMAEPSQQKTMYNAHNANEGIHLVDHYLSFSAKGSALPGSFSPELEKQVLEAMKINDLLVNDIAMTRHSTWNINGSENHDYGKIKAMFYSQIFMHATDYADSVYPNWGVSLGVGLATAKPGPYSDGKPYTARDHYIAWVAYWKEYLAERARWGFFNEQNANRAYGVVAQAYFTRIYLWTADEALRSQARMFLDLMYAQWLQDQMLLIQGGVSCRGEPGQGTFYKAVSFYMGYDANVDAGYVFALSDYAWPRELWEMALDRRGRGEYAYVSRKPHEARDEDPRPEGTEYTMLWRPDSRIVRYSWVTPDYVLGLRMDYPNALYNHIYIPSQGITFPTTPDATILLKAGHVSRAVQDRNVALMQEKHYVSIQHPTHYPNYRDRLLEQAPAVVEIGKDVDVVEEQNGWIFVQEGNAYGAFRFVSAASREPIGRDEHGMALLAVANDNYLLETNAKGVRTFKAKEPMLPLVVEMSRTAQHATLADFKRDVLDNPLRLKVVRHVDVMTYQGCGPEAKELYLNLTNMEAPRIDGKYISYQPPAFDSPWLKGASGSGVVTLTGPISGAKTVLDFNQRSPKKEEAKTK